MPPARRARPRAKAPAPAASAVAQVGVVAWRSLLALVLVSLVLAPTVQAVSAAEHRWHLQPLPAQGTAQVRETLLLDGGGDALTLGLPRGAREVQAFVDGDPAPWAWVGEATLEVALPAAEPATATEARTAEVRYLVSAGPTGVALARPLTLATTLLRVEVALPDGWEARLDGQPLGPDGIALAGPVESGTVLTLEAAPLAGPSPLLVVGSLLLLVLAGTMLRALTARGKARATPQAEMGLLDHVRELQGRLRVALLVVGALMLGLFAFSLRVVDVAGLGPVAVPVPSLEDNIAAQTFRVLAQQFVPPGVELVVVSPITGALVQVEVALFLALLVGSPVVAYEFGMFLMPALHDHERRVLLRAIPAVTGLYVAGAVFAYVVMVPTMMAVLYSYAQGLGARSFLSLDSLVSFAIVITLLFGAAFQLPVGMVALAKLGITTPEGMARKWRHVVVGVFVVAAVITPDPSVVSQLLVAIPLLLLYLAGLVVARLMVGSTASRGQGLSAG